jgi:DNA repair exonuclease SbcCD nuclease subunit
MHLHPWTYGATVNEFGFNSRLWTQRNVLCDQVVPYCRDHNIKTIVVNGDFFHDHSKLNPQVMAVASAFCSAAAIYNIDIYFNLGNHEMYAPGIDTIDWMQGYRNVSVCNTSCGAEYAVRIQDNRIVLFPYTEDKEVLTRFLEEEFEDKDTLFLHQGVANVPMGSGYVINEILTPDIIPDNIMHAFTGHYHKHAKVSDKLTIIGSTVAHNWGDVGDNEKGFIDYDLETGDWTLIPSHAPNFVRMDCGSVSAPVGIENRISQHGSFVRIANYCGDREELRQYLKEHGAITVEFEVGVTESKAAVSVPRNFDFQTDEFFKDISARRKEVGVEIKEERYQLP